MSGSNRDRSIPRRPLLWLAAALLFTLPPMFGSLARWVPCVFLLALAMKFWMEPRGYRLRFAVLKLILAAIGLFAVFASYGSLKSVEPGISLLVVLVSLKVLEAHTAREFQVMVLMGWVLCLCGFFLSQDFVIALSLLIAFALLLVALIQFYRGASPGAVLASIGHDVQNSASGSPARRPLFLLFPANQHWIARLNCVPSVRQAPAFPIDFLPAASQPLQILRRLPFARSFLAVARRHLVRCIGVGVVMWHCNGMEWRAPYVPVVNLFHATAVPGNHSPTRNSAADYARPAWRTLDVCARSAV